MTLPERNAHHVRHQQRTSPAATQQATDGRSRPRSRGASAPGRGGRSPALAGAALARRRSSSAAPARCPAVLFGIGLALGFVLFHSRFGFTSAWRQLVAVRQGKALRAHMLMLAVACTLFAPILAGGVALDGVPAAAVARADRLRAVRRVVPVRRRHAARRLVRLGHAVRGRQRPDGHRDHARRLHRRLDRRRAALPVVDQRPAEPRRRCRWPTAAGLPGRLADLAGRDGRGRRADVRARPSAAASRRSTEPPAHAAPPGRSAARGRCGSARCCWPA